MDAPLARHLVRFSRVPPAGALVAPLAAPTPSVTAEPILTMTAAALEAKLAAARDELRATLEAEHAERSARADAAHAEVVATEVAAATAARDAEEGAAIAAQISSAVQTLRDALAVPLTKAVHALLADAVATRTVAGLVEAVERVLADADHPALTIRGPAPLLAAVEAAMNPAGVTFAIADTGEISVTAHGLRIETRLTAALAALAPMEGA